jgi:hypothetical protein
MAHYFSYVPNLEYVNRLPNAKIGEYTQIKNFFRRGKLFEELFDNLAFFTKYSIIGNERADNIASKFYGDPTLDWVIFLSNNIINVQEEWPLPQQTFDKIMLQKYSSYEELYSGIHHYETLEIKDSIGRVLLEAGKQISPTWSTNGNYVENNGVYYFGFYDSEIQQDVLVPSTDFIAEVTNYQYEVRKEEKKRDIFILKPIYLNVLFENLEEIMTYKEGGTQYINRKLKRGENIRIFEY